jgi:hypothetical protein
MHKVVAIAFASTLVAVPTAGAADARCAAPINLYQPRKGVLPSEVAATDVARTYLSTIYGRQQIENESPLTATLHGDVWHIQGTGNSAPGSKGGVAILEICKSNGRVLSVIHEK